jgi:VCBS repeat-containing protein
MTSRRKGWSLTLLAIGLACLIAAAGQPSAAVEELDATDPCTVSGTAGSDVLTGTSRDDVICGYDGDDVLRGGGGKDRLLGGSGDDRLYGGGDNDRLRAGAGDDRLFGEGGDDNLRGGDGGDEISGGPGRDLGDYLAEDTAVSLSAGNGANDGGTGEGDELRSDVENLRGGSGNDSLQGNGASNWLHGVGGNDRLRGGMANDDLYGGMGRDTLDGRDAASFSDDLFCGGGDDGAMADTDDNVRDDCENVDQNRAPSDLSLSPASVAENQPAATTVGTLTVTDPNAGDTHSYSLVAGAGSGDNGSFTLAGAALRTNAVFDYEARSSYSVRIRVADGDGAAYEEQFAISVTDAVENTNPVAVDDMEGGTEDTQLDLPVSGAGSPAENDTDADSDPLTVTAVANATGGAAAISGGAIEFNPAANLCGVGAGGFDYTVSDGRGGTDAGHVTVDITCVADAPVAVDDSATLAEGDGATAIDVLANDTDPDGGPMAVDTVTQPSNGTVVITGGGTGLTYEPDLNYCNDPPGTAPDTFTYTLAPGGSQATVSVTVDCFDDPPTAVNDTATVAEDSGATAIDVLANDIDIDGGPISVESVTQPANGAVVITGSGTGLTYEPAANFCGPNSFTYTLNGGSTATVSVTVTCVDDLPVAVDDSATVAEDSGATAIDVLANDTDIDGGPISVESVTQPANGAVVITGGGTGLTYEPAANFCGPNSFTYTLNGGSTATVSITVTCVDDAPTAVDDAATVVEDAPATAVDVLANDTDPDGGLKLIVSASDPANGTVVITVGGSGLTYQPDPNYCNNPPGTTPDTFTYTLNGGSTATVSITVTCVDDAPTAVDDTATVLEDAAATAVDVLANDPDPDGGPKTIASASDPANGTVVITGGGAGLTYQPDPNYCGPDTFTYTLNGGSTATVSVTVTCVDDPPTAVNDSATVLEDAAATAVDVLANDTDPDGGPKTIASASDPANGTVVLTGGPPATGLTYQPDANYCGADSFTYTLTGGSTATVSITVTCVPDNPVVDNSAGNTSYTENAAATAIDSAVTVTDPDPGATITGATIQIAPAGAEDILALSGTHPGITSVFSGDALTLSGSASPAAYQAALRAVTYRNSSDAPSTAPRTVTFTVTDETARTGSDTKGLTVAAVDDPPVAVNDSATVLEDAAATAVPVLTNDTDVDGGPKTIGSASDPANGTVVVTGGGTGLTYQPDPNYCNNPPGTTPDTFTYTLNGGSVGTVSMTVTCVNDPPVAGDDSFTGANGALANTRLVLGTTTTGPHLSVAGTVLANDTDPDTPSGLTAGPATISSANCAGCNNVALNSNGSFTYDPPAGFTGTDAFTYTVTDNDPEVPANQTDTATVSIEVVGPLVWYVDIDAAAPPAGQGGRSHSPFNSLAPLTTGGSADGLDGNGDIIFVGIDTAPATGPYDGGIVLETNQRLWGEPFGLTVDPTGPIPSTQLVAATPATPVSSNPNVRNSAAGGVGITLANGVEIQRVNAGVTGAGSATAGISGVATTTATIGPNQLVQGNSTGVSLTGAAGGDITIAATISANTATAVRVENRTSGAVSFVGDISGSAGNAGIFLTGNTGAAIAFTGIVDLSGTGAGISKFSATGGGTITANNVANQITGFAGTGINLNGVSIGTAGVIFNTVSSAGGGAVNGITLISVGGPGALTVNGGAITATTRGLDVDGGSNDITIGASLTTSGAAARSVEVTNRTGGTVDINGLVTDNSTGINLSTNGTSLVRFDGGLVASTGTNTAFNTTVSGNVVVTGTTNTLTTTTGTALNVANTNIGASGLTFRSIASSGGSATGVILDTTGSTGGLTVTGTGTAGSGGTIANKSGADGQTNTGIGIYLNNTANVQLANMQLNDFGNYAIRGTNVDGFILNSSVINATGAGKNGTSAAIDEGSVIFGTRIPPFVNGLTGTASITNTTIEDGFEDTLGVYNASGTLTLTMDNVSVSGAGNDGIVTEQHTGGTINIDVKNSDFAANFGDHFNAAANDAANLVVHFGDNGANALTGGGVGALGQSIAIQTGVAWSGTGSANVSNNTITGAIDTPININIGGTGTFGATVNNNTIGTSGVANSGTVGNKDAIRIVANGDASVDPTPNGGTYTAAVTNNTIQQVSGRGIFALARDGGTATDPIELNLTITGNTLRESLASGGQAIRVESGATSTDDVRVHANIGGAGALANVMPDDWGVNGSGGIDFDEIRITHNFSAACQFILTGLGANTSSVATVSTYLAGRNSLPGGGAGVASATLAGGGVYETGGPPPTP